MLQTRKWYPNSRVRCDEDVPLDYGTCHDRRLMTREKNINAGRGQSRLRARARLSAYKPIISPYCILAVLGMTLILRA